MKYHKYDPQTLLYVETVESEQKPENSVGGSIPEETEYYTLAFIDDSWISVIRPQCDVTNNGIVYKPGYYFINDSVSIRPEYEMTENGVVLKSEYEITENGIIVKKQQEISNEEKNSAKQKLKALGLTDTEINAIIGI